MTKTREERNVEPENQAEDADPNYRKILDAMTVQFGRRQEVTREIERLQGILLRSRVRRSMGLDPWINEDL